MENCTLCLKRSKFNHSFLSMPFCSKCGDKLYDGSINISKSMKENKLIFNDNKEDHSSLSYKEDNSSNSDKEENNKPDFLLTKNEKLTLIKNKLNISKYLIDEMIENINNTCILNKDIRKLNCAVQQAFYYIDR